MWILVGRGVGERLLLLRRDERDLDLERGLAAAGFSSRAGDAFRFGGSFSFSLAPSFSFSRSFSFLSFSLLLRGVGLLADLEVLRLGRVRSLSLLEEELSDDELLDRELLPELELLDDLEPLDVLESEELRLLSLLLEPDSDLRFLSRPRSFFLSLSFSSSDAEPFRAIL